MRNLLTWTMRWRTQEGEEVVICVWCNMLENYLWDSQKVRRRVRLVMRNDDEFDGDAGCRKMWKGTICNPWVSVQDEWKDGKIPRLLFTSKTRLESRSQGVNEFRFPNVLPQSKKLSTTTMNLCRCDLNGQKNIEFYSKLVQIIKKHFLLFSLVEFTRDWADKLVRPIRDVLRWMKGKQSKKWRKRRLLASDQHGTFERSRVPLAAKMTKS